MGVISLRLPESLHDKTRIVAKEESISINQLIAVALAEKISALKTVDYLGGRAKKGDRKAFEHALLKVSDGNPGWQDRLADKELRR